MGMQSHHRILPIPAPAYWPDNCFDEYRDIAIFGDTIKYRDLFSKCEPYVCMYEHAHFNVRRYARMNMRAYLRVCRFVDIVA